MSGDLSGADWAKAVFCATKCYACQFGFHFDPPGTHTWGDVDDFDHAKATGQPMPGNCGCPCAKDPGDAPMPTEGI